jgi:hypothetical protein
MNTPEWNRPELFVMPDGQRYQMHKGGLFCINTGRYYKPGSFTPKQKRAFMRLNSGMTLGEVKKELLCFITLSTKYETTDSKNRFSRTPKLNYAFTKLKQQIETYLTNNIYEKYCKKHSLTAWEGRGRKNRKSVKYPNIYSKCRFKFKYFKVKTAEGGGVLHIVFRKSRTVPKIPYEWLSKTWEKIWGSWNVSISQIVPRSKDRLCMYMVGQYFAKQPVIRMSYGQQWVYQSFYKSFKHLIEVYGFTRAKEVWHNLLAHPSNLPDGGRQKRFRHRRLKPNGAPRILYRARTVQVRIDSNKYTGFEEGANIFTVFSAYPKEKRKFPKLLVKPKLSSVTL